MAPFWVEVAEPSRIIVVAGQSSDGSQSMKVNFRISVHRRIHRRATLHRRDYSTLATIIGGYAMKRTLCLFSLSKLIILTGFLAGAGVAEAQLVQIGPGYVKAPFVRVYRTRNGTSVRAPFTHVESGAPAYGRQLRQGPYAHPYGDPQAGGYDNGDATAAISLMERQRRLVARAARRLDRDLLRFRTGSHWQAFLRLPPELLNAHRIAGRGVMVQLDPVAVQAALNNFDTVASNDQYRKIAQLSSFRSTHRLLREYVWLLSLPSADPLPPGPEAFGQRSVLVPPTVEQPPEELRLPDLEVPQ